MDQTKNLKNEIATIQEKIDHAVDSIEKRNPIDINSLKETQERITLLTEQTTMKIKETDQKKREMDQTAVPFSMLSKTLDSFALFGEKMIKMIDQLEKDNKNVNY